MQQIALFFRLWIWFGFRQLLAHRGRTMAVLLGIALGAAVFTSVRLAIDASLDSFSRSVDILSGKADRVVLCPGGRVPEGLVPELLKLPAVRAASPLLTAYVQPEREEEDPFLLIGFDPLLDRSLRDWQIERQENSAQAASWLDLLGKPYTLLIGQKLADRWQASAGTPITLEHIEHRKTFTVLGTLDSRGLALLNGGEAALADIATVQEFMGLHGQVDRIDLVLQPGAGAADLKAIEALLPEGVVLEHPSETKETGRLLIRSYQLNLSVLSFVSLFVGMFLVYSLVSLHATSRRHELAILRSLGGSSRMLFFLFLAEGAFFGIVGWVLAFPLGSFMVKLLLGKVSATITHLFVRVHVDRLTLNPWEIALSLLITVGIAILAACQPASEAMRVPPREAFEMLDTCPERERSVRSLAFWGVLLIALVWPLSRLPGAGGVPVPGYVATFLLFCGFSLLSPWCLKLAGSRLPALMRRLGGEPAYLGGRTIRDAGARIAVSVGALITAMALFVALVIMVHSFRNTVQTWVEQSISGDLFLRPQVADLNEYRDPIPPEVVKTLRNDPSIDLLPYRRIFLHYGPVPYQFEPIDFETFDRYARFLLIGGDAQKILPQLIDGRGVLVSEVFANRTGLRVGQRFHAQIEGTDLDLPVLGIFRDYRTQGGVVHYSLARFSEQTGDGSWSGVRIYFREAPSDPEAAAARLRSELLRKCGERHRNALEITVGGDLRRAILKIFDETFAITGVLLLIALGVAALGITTTLAVLVLERTRQFHTILSGGASRMQVRAMVCWEAILMVLIGESIGLVCGFMLSYLLIFVINRQSFGWTFLYGVDWSFLLISLPLILATALLAALPATQLVFKHPPAMVLRQR